MLMKIPPVAPSIVQPDPDELTGGMADSLLVGGPEAIAPEDRASFARLLESPSTLTLKQRRQPFLGVDYAIQVCWEMQ
jgi:hypothetical protein